MAYKVSKGWIAIHITLSILTVGFWIPIALAIEWLRERQRQGKSLVTWSDNKIPLNELGKRSTFDGNTKNKKMTKRKIRELMKRTAVIEGDLAKIQMAIDSRENFQIKINEILSSQDLNSRLLTLNHVRLMESRAGVTKTDTSGTFDSITNTGTIGISGKHLGIAASQGRTRGKINTQSVTGPAPDVMTMIDKGVVFVTNSLITFSGSQFTRTANFSNIVMWRPGANSVSISTIDATKIWVLDFDNADDCQILIGILRAVDKLPNKIIGRNQLEIFGKNISEDIITQIEVFRANCSALEEEKVEITEILQTRNSVAENSGIRAVESGTLKKQIRK